MGELEHKSRIRTQRNQLRNIILTTVKVSGLLALTAVAPNSIGALQKLGLIPGKRHSELAKRSVDRLIGAELLVVENRCLRLTAKGEAELRRIEARNYFLKEPKRWDKKWRVLIFDIPERKKGLRDKIRKALNDIGFYRMQDSVWIYPHDCEDLINLIKADLKVGYDVLYMIVESLQGDGRIKRHFGITA